jgi:hypothetical protein
MRPVTENNLAERVKSPDMAKYPALFLLVAFAAASGQDNSTATFKADVIAVTLNGGLKAQLVSVGRDTGARPVINAVVKITNAGKDYAFLMFYGSVSAIDEAGISFEPPSEAVTGVGYCNTVPAERCIGKPDMTLAFSPQSYTLIEPGNSVTAHFRLVASPGAAGKASRGNVSLSAQYGYRLVKAADMEKDADIGDAQKLRQVRTGNMSFPPAPVAEK